MFFRRLGSNDDGGVLSQKSTPRFEPSAVWNWNERFVNDDRSEVPPDHWSNQSERCKEGFALAIRHESEVSGFDSQRQ